MTQNSNCRKRPNILITGTPCTRKMTTAAFLAVMIELRHINVDDFVNEENLTNGSDDTFDCYYINEDLVTHWTGSVRTKQCTIFVRPTPQSGWPI
uniref:Adenylate kinase isoenzyme 6 n=1 Tax=Solanum tuberosum TaxID=4113 RepID=M1DIF1_SOLTU